MSTKDDEILGLLSRMMEEQRDARTENMKAFSDLDKKVDLHIQRTEYELKSINEQDAIQNKLLDQHIEGVNTLKKIYDAHELSNNERFAKIEEPRKFLKNVTKVLLWLGGLGTAAMGILEVISWFKGH